MASPKEWKILRDPETSKNVSLRARLVGLAKSHLEPSSSNDTDIITELEDSGQPISVIAPKNIDAKGWVLGVVLVGFDKKKLNLGDDKGNEDTASLAFDYDDDGRKTRYTIDMERQLPVLNTIRGGMTEVINKDVVSINMSEKKSRIYYKRLPVTMTPNTIVNAGYVGQDSFQIDSGLLVIFNHDLRTTSGAVSPMYDDRVFANQASKIAA